MTRARVGWLGIATAMSLGCNALTGADGVEIDGSASDRPALVLADGVVIEAVALNQGVRRPLMEGGVEAASDVPIVAGRDALLRIHYRVEPAFNGMPVTARAVFGDSEPVTAELTLKATPSDIAVLDSTANLDIPGDRIDELTDVRVELLQAPSLASGDNSAAAYPSPAEEPAEVPARSAGDALEIYIVPIRYDADGSGRLPDTSEAQLALLKEKFYQRYPTPAVEIRVGAEMAWDQPVSRNGAGWGELLQAMVDFRQSTDANEREHLYGMFRPADTFGDFCQGGCQAGLSQLGNASDPLSRVGIGLGFGRDGSAETAVHEIGHQHGRRHADCGGADGVDPDYPYPMASIGSYGYDLVGKALVAPDDAVDFMSYCDPTWVSDYGFKDLFSHLHQVSMLQVTAFHAEPQRYARLLIGPDGSVRWLEPLVLSRPPSAEPVAVEADTAAGPRRLEGTLYRFSHLAGGMLLVPDDGSLDAVAFAHDGRRLVLRR